MSVTCAFIFARGGSKGLPKKNILSIGGLPLIAHGIQLAGRMKQIDNIYVSTDCTEIASIAQNYGAEIIQRPPELATDNASEWSAWQHAIKHVNNKIGGFDCFLSLPATSPLRRMKDVETCLNALQPGIDIVVTMTSSHRSPWFNMVKRDSFGKVSLLMEDKIVHRRQDTKKCFDMTTVAYVSRPEFILNASSMWDGFVAGVEIPQQYAIDIDNKIDFSIASFLMENNEHL